MGNAACCPTDCLPRWGGDGGDGGGGGGGEPGEDPRGPATPFVTRQDADQPGAARGFAARNMGSSASIPMSRSAASTTAAAAALLQKFKSGSSSLPPSVEDEREYMRESWDKIFETQRNAPEECVLCLEEFSIEAPAVRTLCKCGVNRHHYHLGCLLTWRRRSGKTTCPVCDDELFFEEDGAAVQGHSAPSALMARPPV